MSEIDNGGPAFPHWDGPNGKCFGGLTKREWFAGMALQGLLANAEITGGDSRPVDLRVRHRLASEARKRRNTQ